MFVILFFDGQIDVITLVFQSFRDYLKDTEKGIVVGYNKITCLLVGMSISGIRPDSKFDIRPDIQLAGYLEPDKPNILNNQLN